MSDPAVEAAQRAWTADGWSGYLELSEGSLAIAAAREALKPIRDADVVLVDGDARDQIRPGDVPPCGHWVGPKPETEGER